MLLRWCHTEVTHLTMHIPSYLTRSRHDVWYFRYPLPVSLHPEGRASQIYLSLRTPVGMAGVDCFKALSKTACSHRGASVRLWA